MDGREAARQIAFYRAAPVDYREEATVRDGSDMGDSFAAVPGSENQGDRRLDSIGQRGGRKATKDNHVKPRKRAASEPSAHGNVERETCDSSPSLMADFDDVAAKYSSSASAETEPNPARRAKQPRNELTHLVPGYTAPLALSSSSLDRYRSASGTGGGVEGLEAIRRRALLEDHPVRNKTKPAGSGAWKSHVKPSLGHASKAWFQRMSTPLTEDIKKDLQLIRNRNYLDPKRFYKKGNNLIGKHVQVGTVVEGAAEYYSSRLTKRERRSNLVDEVLADPGASSYAKNKFKMMQQEKTAAAHKRKRRGLGRRGPQKRR